MCFLFFFRWTLPRSTAWHLCTTAAPREVPCVSSCCCKTELTLKLHTHTSPQLCTRPAREVTFKKASGPVFMDTTPCSFTVFFFFQVTVSVWSRSCLVEQIDPDYEVPHLGSALYISCLHKHTACSQVLLHRGTSNLITFISIGSGEGKTHF